MLDSVEDYRRVCREEYQSAAVFGSIFMASCYGLGHNFSNEGSYSSIFICILSSVIFGPLALNSFRQGRNLTQKISELERKLHHPENQ